jgi:hypothetical protein
MPVPHSEAQAYLASHSGVFGNQWTEIDSLEGLDPDEYELEEVCKAHLELWTDDRMRNMLRWI